MKLNIYAAGGGNAELNCGPTIKRWRVDACMTQAVLAELLGVDPTSISRWERGRDKPDLVRRRQLRALVEPARCHCPDCGVLMGLVSALLEPGAEANLHVWRQHARSALGRMRQETCHAEG